MGPTPQLTASEREQTVTLYPKLVISGRVTDAETGRPVLKFRVVKGLEARSAGTRSTGPRTMARGGHGRSIHGPVRSSGEGAFVRIEAPGYKPAVSRAFQPTEGSQTFDFALQPAKGLSGIVLLPGRQARAGRRGRAGTQAESV